MKNYSNEYRDRLYEEGLSNSQRHEKNSARFFSTLRQLELGGEDESCIICGAKTYKDACVLIRPGEWARPRSFHKFDCKLKELMYEVHAEIVEDEQRVEKIWNATEGKAMMKDAVARAKKVLEDLKDNSK